MGKGVSMTDKKIGPLSQLTTINPFGVEMRDDSAFEKRNEAYRMGHKPIIRYDNVSYCCIKSNDEQCRGHCPCCSFGISI